MSNMHIFPRKPRFDYPEFDDGYTSVSDSGVVYLGFDVVVGWDVWLVGNKIRFASKLGFIDEFISVESPKVIDQPRRWVPFAIRHRFLKDIFVLWECKCGDAQLTQLEFDDDDRAVVPECENSDCEVEDGKATKPVCIDFASGMFNFLTEEWGQERAEKNGGDRYRVMEIQWHDDYAESGYSLPEGSPGILTADWNRVSKYNNDTNQYETVDDTLPVLSKFFETMGFELEWSDEWVTCEGCQKLLRTSPDSYCWQPSYFLDDGCGYYCSDCWDEEEILESLEGRDDDALNLIKPIDPTDHGYVLLEDKFEHGFHKGMDADPKVIAESLRKLGVTRFLFMITESSQFYTTFAVYVHEDEFEKADVPAWSAAKKNGPSVSEGLKRALQSAELSHSGKNDGTIQVAHVDASTGSATSVPVSPEDFVKGRALDIAKEAHEQRMNEEQ